MAMMSKLSKFKKTSHVIYRHGNPIEVATYTLEGQPPPPSERRKDRFVKLPIGDVVPVFTALHCPMALVWCALVYLAWEKKSDEVRLPTSQLRLWGVKRRTWARALTRLERAGWIKTERRPGKAIICRLTRPQT